MRKPFNPGMTSKLSVVAVSGMALMYSSGAFAENFRDYLEPSGYVGGDAGFFTSSGDEFDDEDFVWGGVAGVKFNQYVGLEGSYSNFGEYGGDVATAEVDGWGVALVGAVPVMDLFSVYGKIGQFYSNVDVDIGGMDSDFQDNQVFFGVGAEYGIFEPVSLTAEYARYKVGMDENDFDAPEDFEGSDTDIDTFKLGARYNFNFMR